MIWIAFSGLGNTGKSTLIGTLTEKLSLKGYVVQSFYEVARRLKSIKQDWNWDDFQHEILKEEIERVRLLKPGFLTKECEVLEKVVFFFDRAYSDNLCYRLFNRMKGKCYEPIDETLEAQLNEIPKNFYDAVFLFDTQIKNYSTEDFKHYDEDNQVLNHIFQKTTQERHSNVISMRNGMENGEEVIKQVGDLLGIDLFDTGTTT